MNKFERRLINLSKYKKIVAILTLILFFLSGYLNPNVVYAENEYAWPVPNFGRDRITSPYGMRAHPILGQRRKHTGIDISAPKGKPVVASKAGTVYSAGWGGSYGNLIVIQHDDGHATAYAHLSKVAVKKGDRVNQKQTIGYIGSTGRSTGPHLHFEIRKSVRYGTDVNPLPFLNGETNFDAGPDDNGGASGGGGSNGNSYDPSEYGSGYASNGLNIITNSKFYYQGAPKGHYQAKVGFLEKIVNFIASIGKYLLTLLINVLFKLPFLGYAALFEKMITDTFNSLAGEEEYISRGTNTDLYIDPRRAVNVENIIFGRVELLNVDFFIDPTKAAKRMEGLTGSGQEIEEIQRRARITDNAGIAPEYTAEPVNYEESAIGMLRENYSKIYYTVFSISIALMLFAILGVAIRILISTTGSDKAKYKALLSDWFIAFITLLGSILFIFFIIKLNAYLISMFIDIAKAYLKDGLLEDTSSIYETVRTRAYDNKFSVGFPATVVYLILIWDTIKFSLTYIRRLINILILAMIGPFNNAFQILSNVFRNKPGDRSKIKKWGKDISTLVFLQTIHAAVYTFIMIISFKLLDEITFVNFILMIGLHSLLYQLPEYLKSIFKLSSDGSAVSDVMDKNQIDRASKTMNTLIGGKYAKEAYYKSVGQTKQLFKTAGKQISGAASTVGRGAVNTGLFFNDYFTGKNRKDPEGNDLTKDAVEVRGQNIDLIAEEIDKLGIDEDVTQYLNLLSTSELEKLKNDPEKIKDFALNIDKQNLKDIFNEDPKFTDPITYKEKQLAQKQLKKENRKERIQEAIANNKPFYIDENGTYRMLPPVKEFNPITEKMEEINPGSKEYFDKLKEAFGLETDKFKEAGKVSLDTLKVGLSVLGAALIIPGLLGDPSHAKTLFNSWVGAQVFKPIKNKDKQNYFKDFKEDVNKYLLPSNNYKVKRSVERTRKRVQKGMPIDYDDAKEIIENAKFEIKEYQYEQLLAAYPDLESKTFRRATKNIQNKNYTYDLNELSGNLPYDLKVRREENNLLKELETLAILDYQSEILDLSKYAKTYFELNNGEINHEKFTEEFNITNIDEKIEESNNLKTIYLDAASINKKTDDKLLEAEIFELGDKEISKINIKKDKELEKLSEGLDESQKEEILKLSPKKLEQKAKEQEKKLEQFSTKVILNQFKNEKIDKILESAQNKEIDNILEEKLKFKDETTKEQVVAKSLMTISNIYNETADTEALKILGKKDFDEVKAIENKLEEKIKEDKIKEISESKVSEKEKNKQIDKILKQKKTKELYSQENIEKYITDEEEREKLKKFQNIKLQEMEELNKKTIEEVVKKWEDNSKEIVDAIKVQNDKYYEALDEKIQILNAMQKEENINNAFKNRKTKDGKVKLKVERTTKKKDPQENLKDILGKYYL